VSDEGRWNLPEACTVLEGMWRSVSMGLVLAGMLAGCSFLSSSGHDGSTGLTAYPKMTLVVRVFQVTAHGDQKVVAMWRLGCSPPSGPRMGGSGSWQNPSPAVACHALRDDSDGRVGRQRCQRHSAGLRL
jgi:hypothetical protein